MDLKNVEHFRAQSGKTLFRYSKLGAEWDLDMDTALQSAALSSDIQGTKLIHPDKKVLGMCIFMTEKVMNSNWYRNNANDALPSPPWILASIIQTSKARHDCVIKADYRAGWLANQV